MPLRAGRYTGDGEKYSESGWILEVEPSGLVDELNRGCEGKVGIGDMAFCHPESFLFSFFT